ncbi:EamA family transporter RarD [Zavarzinia compransoris]|uniref:EamA family transporter RarD n=1 Tax=Zavarzinia compransoris TaxID=1264899 RepID=A0A317EAG2_9PROT|nr:EamA family transporter RarD [Zavarzinia compransoris]PWR23939.1 EamA family transporter RarD [Zavarzinia compransoris]TDP48186.1 chloramphenicol-sensitive protein RarD [Zavarzinia compransoris]
MAETTTGERHSASLAGAGYAVAAYLTWALLALYWKALAHVPAFEVMLHRAVWSTLFLLGLLAATGRLPDLLAALRRPRRLLILALTAVLLASNWYLFIWAMGADLALEASLGYYINPLVNVLFGVVFLRERLSRYRQVAVAMATIGVVILSASMGVPPWVALFLASTFGLYGLLRKMAPADPMVGLTLESLWLAIIAVPWLLWLEGHGRGGLGEFGPVTDILLVAAGVVTAVPLLWFNAAAKRLTLSTLGLFQYIAPTGMFLIAVFINGEAFTAIHAVTFGLIWGALALVAVETLRNRG